MPPEDTQVLDQQPAEAPSLRETLEKVVEKNPIEAPAPAPERKPVEAREPKEPAKEPGYLETKEPPAKEPAQEEHHAEERNEPAESTSIDRAPKSWKPAVREKWAALDPEVRAEVVRRDREINRALGESTNARKFAQTFHQATGPFAARYQQAGLDPVQTVVNLMQADHFLSSAPAPDRAKFMAKMIRDYQIDINMLDQAISGEGNPSQEPMAIIERIVGEKLAPVQQFIQNNQNSRAQQEAHEIQVQTNKLNAMAADEVKYPWFGDVRADMADLIEISLRRGVYLDPETAYTRAVAMNPEASAAEQGRLGQQKAMKANDAATRSLGASLSINGAPASLSKPVSPDDLRGTIEAAYRDALERR